MPSVLKYWRFNWETIAIPASIGCKTTELIRVGRINPTKSLSVSDLAMKGKMEALGLFLSFLSHQYTQVATYYTFSLLFLLLLYLTCDVLRTNVKKEIDLDVGED